MIFGIALPLNSTFKALADPTRRKIIILLRDGNLTAGQIANHFSVSKPTISHHLSILKDAGLVYDCRNGKFIYYILNLSVFERAMNWLQLFLGSEKARSKNETGGGSKK